MSALSDRLAEVDAPRADRHRVGYEAWVLPAVVGLVALVPALVEGKFLVFQATQACIYMIVAMGLNVVAGYAGQTSLAQGALVAIGAYASAILMVKLQLSFWIAAPCAMAITSVAGALVALPALRLSTWYFALISLSFASVVGELIVEWRSLTGGFTGIVGIPRPALWGYTLSDHALYVLALAAAAATFFLVRNLVDSRFGRAMVAVRDNPLAATASGASLLSVKMFAFVVSAALAGLGGAFFAVQKSVISVDDFGTDFSIFFLLIMVVGGSGRRWGPIVGTLVFFLVPELLGALQSWRLLVYGVLLLVLMLFAPEGVVGGFERLLKHRRGPVKVAPSPKPAGDAERVSVVGAELSVTDVRKRFGGVLALDGVTLQVPAGATYAVVGPNGSGKTTLLNLICGLVRADEGTVLLDGQSLRGKAPHQLARAGVGRTFQTPKLLGEMTLLDNVLLGAYAGERASLVEVALRLPRARRENELLRARALRLLDFVGLGASSDRIAGEVPHGQQRLLEIARALLAQPRLLLLDEPAAGLSLHELDRLGALIREIAAQGCTVVIVEHHLELVGEISDAVTVLDRGRVLTAGTAEEVFSHPEVLDAYMGRAREAVA
ncbi:MAG: Amino acid/amide transporter rane protein 2, family /amino acid/amide transporter [Rhizobacter sp.]|nr:Amino acid/amide transporter rane protein 2, family /amino acid/amide transporter [Rhizobacter sp.]